MNTIYKVIVLISIFLMLNLKLAAHPLHITITNIDFKNDSVYVAVSMDGHNVEDAMSSLGYHDFIYENIVESQESRIIVSDYIAKHLKLKLQNSIDLSLAETKIIDRNVWLYFKAPCVMVEQFMVLENTLLEGLHGDQKNMVIVSINGLEKGVEFNAVETKKTITLVE